MQIFFSTHSQITLSSTLRNSTLVFINFCCLFHNIFKRFREKTAAESIKFYNSFFCFSDKSVPIELIKCSISFFSHLDSEKLEGYYEDLLGFQCVVRSLSPRWRHSPFHSLSNPFLQLLFNFNSQGTFHFAGFVSYGICLWFATSHWCF